LNPDETPVTSQTRGRSVNVAPECPARRSSRIDGTAALTKF
jgi:hypothetical protein